MPFESIFSIKDIIDIVLVAFLLYQTYQLMRKSGSIRLFAGVLVFAVIWVMVSQVFQMRLLGAIFDKLVSVGAIGVIILFQEDIRKFFLSLGSRDSSFNLFKFFRSHQRGKDRSEMILPLVIACKNMAREKVGALIVIEQSLPLDEVVKTGDTIDANINQRLIENIFFKNSPLHDGAMVIADNRIKAAGCILPVSHDLSIPKHLGLRHRAAMGISQESDAIVIIVSEETGNISIAHKGRFHLHLSPEELESMLTHGME